MPRPSIALAVALATGVAALALATPAAAAPEGTVDAFADPVLLSGDPFRPSGQMTVQVRNDNVRAETWFLVTLPETVDLVSGEGCQPDTTVDTRTWVCGGDILKAGETRDYRVTIASATPEPVFGTVEFGSVAGRDADGHRGQSRDVRISWPDKVALKLRATASPVTGGASEVKVRVTNADTFAISGYSLDVTTPAGVRVTSPACSTRGRAHGADCEIPRTHRLAAGATDTFTLRLAVSGTPKEVGLRLLPTQRYTNADTSVTVRLEAAGTPSPSGRPTSSASPTTGAPSATPTPAATAELPRTGPGLAPYALAGVAMLLLGGGLLLLQRRLSGRRCG